MDWILSSKIQLGAKENKRMIGMIALSTLYLHLTIAIGNENLLNWPAFVAAIDPALVFGVPE